MPVPEQSVTLTAGEIEGLRVQLSTLRHDVNNHISMIIAAAELIRRKPEQASRFLQSLSDPAEKIGAEIKEFSKSLESVLGIAPDSSVK